MLGTVLILLLILALVGTWPMWPHSRQWGYMPSGTLGVLLVFVLAVVVVTGM